MCVEGKIINYAVMNKVTKWCIHFLDFFSAYTSCDVKSYF